MVASVADPKVSGGGLRLLRSFLLTTSGNFTPSADAIELRGYLFAGGGGGKGGEAQQNPNTTHSTTDGGWAGSGGSIARFEVNVEQLLDYLDSAAIPYVIGAGGVGGVGGFIAGAVNDATGSSETAESGSVGGTTSFGPLSVSSTGAVNELIDHRRLSMSAAGIVTNVGNPVNAGNPSGRGLVGFKAAGGGTASNSTNSTSGVGGYSGGFSLGLGINQVTTPAGTTSQSYQTNSTSGLTGSTGETGLAGVPEFGLGGNGGGAGTGVTRNTSSTTGQGTNTGGRGGDGGFPGGGGGGGGFAAVYRATATVDYGDITGGRGGDGGAGAIYVEEWGF